MVWWVMSGMPLDKKRMYLKCLFPRGPNADLWSSNMTPKVRTHTRAMQNMISTTWLQSFQRSGMEYSSFSSFPRPQMQHRDTTKLMLEVRQHDRSSEGGKRQL